MSGLMFPKNPGKKRKKIHPKSVMHQKDGTCYLCMELHDDYRYHRVLHEHHIFGAANRSLSEKYGLKVYLCVEHHMTGAEAVHSCSEIMDFLHKKGSRNLNKIIAGKNYGNFRKKLSVGGK